jgi:glycosyltransferase involved in cell wall biosynthesis
MPHDAPSVSAILLCCNCEAFVREAVESVLAQDYPGPLEILISDDASQDRTLDVVRDTIADHTWEHRVRLLERDQNTGSKSAHLNHVFAEASGEIFVSFDDDDVSRPDRIRKLVEAFADPEVQAVYSSFSLIDVTGKARGAGSVPHPSPSQNVREWFARVDAYAAGTTLSVRRNVVVSFGQLPADVHEDITLPFRASLLGDVRYIAEPLVKARRRGTSLTTDLSRFASLASYRRRMQRGIDQAQRNLATRRADLDTALALRPERRSELATLREIAQESFAIAEFTLKLSSDSFLERFSALLRLIRIGAYRDELAQHAFLALLPETYLGFKRRTLGVDDPKRPDDGNK